MLQTLFTHQFLCSTNVVVASMLPTEDGAKADMVLVLMWAHKKGTRNTHAAYLPPPKSLIPGSQNWIEPE